MAAKRRRSDATKRLTQAGWNPREAVEVLLASVAFDLQDLLLDESLADGERVSLAEFHRSLKQLFEATLSVDPPMDPGEIADRIDALTAELPAPIDRFRERLDRAAAKSRTLAR